MALRLRGHGQGCGRRCRRRCRRRALATANCELRTANCGAPFPPEQGAQRPWRLCCAVRLPPCRTPPPGRAGPGNRAGRRRGRDDLTLPVSYVDGNLSIQQRAINAMRSSVANPSPLLPRHRRLDLTFTSRRPHPRCSSVPRDAPCPSASKNSLIYK